VRQIVFLRGINLGATNRIAMPKLRQALAGAGFENVGTYLQSGNVVVSSGLRPAALEQRCKRLIADEFGLDIDVVVRTRAELARVVRRNPLRDVVTDPKRYQVSFLAKKLPAQTLARLEAAVVPPEQLVASGRELYAWHPKGVARSRLWAQLAGKELGVVATARNWTTVTSLLELADA
jgi:uncharacterized protein (DUF1697 family)